MKSIFKNIKKKLNIGPKKGAYNAESFMSKEDKKTEKKLKRYKSMSLSMQNLSDSNVYDDNLKVNSSCDDYYLTPVNYVPEQRNTSNPSTPAPSKECNNVVTVKVKPKMKPVEEDYYEKYETESDASFKSCLNDDYIDFKTEYVEDYNSNQEDNLLVKSTTLKYNQDLKNLINQINEEENNQTIYEAVNDKRQVNNEEEIENINEHTNYDKLQHFKVDEEDDYAYIDYEQEKIQTENEIKKKVNNPEEFQNESRPLFVLTNNTITPEDDLDNFAEDLDVYDNLSHKYSMDDLTKINQFEKYLHSRGVEPLSDVEWKKENDTEPLRIHNNEYDFRDVEEDHQTYYDQSVRESQELEINSNKWANNKKNSLNEIFKDVHRETDDETKTEENDYEEVNYPSNIIGLNIGKDDLILEEKSIETDEAVIVDYPHNTSRFNIENEDAIREEKHIKTNEAITDTVNVIDEIELSCEKQNLTAECNNKLIKNQETSKSKILDYNIDNNYNKTSTDINNEIFYNDNTSQKKDYQNIGIDTDLSSKDMENTEMSILENIPNYENVNNIPIFNVDNVEYFDSSVLVDVNSNDNIVDDGERQIVFEQLEQMREVIYGIEDEIYSSVYNKSELLLKLSQELRKLNTFDVYNLDEELLNLQEVILSQIQFCIQELNSSKSTNDS